LGDIRALSGKDGIFLNEEHTIFGLSAAVGIAISLLVKKKQKQKVHCEVRYIHPCDIRATREEKFAYLQKNPIRQIEFKRLRPDRASNWINIPDNGFDSLIPLADRDTKNVKVKSNERAIFRLYTLGIKSGRDDWVFDFSISDLKAKINFLLDFYGEELRRLPSDSKVVDIDSFVRPANGMDGSPAHPAD
jgi:predicted helicase